MQSLHTFTTPPHSCSYLPAEVSSMRYEIVADLTPAEYLARMNAGWRRFGHSLFKPECATCRKCQAIRVPIAAFQPDRSQQRAWKANVREVRVTIGPPSVTEAKLALYDRYHAFMEGYKDWPSHGSQDAENYFDSFVRNPFATQEWQYHLDDTLVGVGYVDVVPTALSAIYFFYAPEERDRGLGTFNVLSILRAAADAGLPYLHLGFYVAGCASLEYKARFRPNELRQADGTWRAYRE